MRYKTPKNTPSSRYVNYSRSWSCFSIWVATFWSDFSFKTLTVPWCEFASASFSRADYTKLYEVLPSSSKVKTMAAAEPDYYELLGVSKGATLQEIRAEFRILETRWCKCRLYGKSGNSRRSKYLRVLDESFWWFWLAVCASTSLSKGKVVACCQSWELVCECLWQGAMMCNDVQWCAMVHSCVIAIMLCYAGGKKVLAEHPDKGGDPKKFQLLNKARSVSVCAVEISRIEIMFISCSFHVLYDVYMFLSSWSFWNSALASHKNEETLLTRSSSAWNLKMAFESLNILNEILGPEYDTSIAKQEEKT